MCLRHHRFQNCRWGLAYVINPARLQQGGQRDRRRLRIDGFHEYRRTCDHVLPCWHRRVAVHRFACVRTLFRGVHTHTLSVMTSLAVRSGPPARGTVTRRHNVSGCSQYFHCCDFAHRIGAPEPASPSLLPPSPGTVDFFENLSARPQPCCWWGSEPKLETPRPDYAVNASPRIRVHASSLLPSTQLSYLQRFMMAF